MKVRIGIMLVVGLILAALFIWVDYAAEHLRIDAPPASEPEKPLQLRWD
jgi:hypothetical protein